MTIPLKRIKVVFTCRKILIVIFFSDTDALAQTGPTNYNWYPRKKELERQMAGTQNELNKSHKELNSLHQMMQTYQKQPKFGDSKKFQKDIQRAEMAVKGFEDRMTSLKVS